MNKGVVCVSTGDRFPVCVVCSLSVIYFFIKRRCTFRYVVIIHGFFLFKISPISSSNVAALCTDGGTVC